MSNAASFAKAEKRIVAMSVCVWTRLLGVQYRKPHADQLFSVFIDIRGLTSLFRLYRLTTK
jgi:hypothetical protein